MIIFIIILVSVVLGAMFFGAGISIDASLEIVAGLLTTSSVVLAILGALLAISYPEKIRSAIRKDRSKESTQESDGSFSEIADPMMNSSALLIVLVATTVLGPLLDAKFGKVPAVQHFFFIYVSLLAVWQMIIIFRALLPVDTIKTKVLKNEARNSIRTKLHAKKPPVNDEVS